LAESTLIFSTGSGIATSSALSARCSRSDGIHATVRTSVTPEIRRISAIKLLKKVELANPASCQLFGQTQARLRSHPVAQLITDFNLQRWLEGNPDLAKGAGILGRQRLQLTPHTYGGAQHHHGAGQHTFGQTQARLRSHPVAQLITDFNLQRWLEGNPLESHTGKLYFAFGIQRQYRFRHRHQQRAQRQMFPL
jgi:hypothetical protein